MSFLTTSSVFSNLKMGMLAGTLLLAAQDVAAQNQESRFSQQNPSGDFGQGSQTTLGDTGQGQGPGPGQGRLPRAGLRRQSGRQPAGGLQGGKRQDNFVGSDAQQLRDQFNNRNQGQARRAMFDFAIESLNEMRESRRQQRSGRNQRPSVRVQLRPLFTVPQRSASELTAQASLQFSKALPTTVVASQISVQGGIATLTGRVKSEYDKRLAAKLLSLQPGILQVDNRLIIELGQAEPLLLPAR